MNKIIVYVDDAAHAAPRLVPVKDGAGTHWILVACAPRLTHRISKWVSHSARENWRLKWSDKLFGQVSPPLLARGDTVTTVLATGPLPELTDRLINQHGPARVLDVRRPKFAHDLPPVTNEPPAGANGAGWKMPGSILSIGAALMLAAD